MASRLLFLYKISIALMIGVRINNQSACDGNVNMMSPFEMRYNRIQHLRSKASAKIWMCVHTDDCKSMNLENIYSYTYRFETILASVPHKRCGNKACGG